MSTRTPPSAVTENWRRPFGSKGIRRPLDVEHVDVELAVAELPTLCREGSASGKLIQALEERR